jgi:hypothetical protein
MAGWKDGIEKCFNAAGQFATGSREMGQAIAVIKAARRAGATREDLWSAMLGHLCPLYGGLPTIAQLEVQRKILRALWPDRRLL